MKSKIKKLTNNAKIHTLFFSLGKVIDKASWPLFRATGFITRPITKRLRRPIVVIKHRLSRVINCVGQRRFKWFCFGLSVLAVAAVVIGLVAYERSLIAASYRLPVAEQALIGQPDKSLLSQFTYDAKTHAYYLNKSATNPTKKPSVPGVPSTADSVTVGSNTNSKTQFSLKLPINANLGITTYDNNSNLSFTMIPLFSTLAGKQVSGHTVYPMGLDGPKAVYSIKANGVQEDIIYARAPKVSVKLRYKLELPSTLQAKMMPGGNIGIYSASPYLFGNISYGSAKDQALVAKARLNAAKTNLVFVLPAPEITDNDGMAPTNVQQQTKFSLKGDILTLTASDLGGIHGPISIDPSVIDASASSFGQGNNESDISFANSSISEAGLSGGGLAGNTNSCGASWCASTYYRPTATCRLLPGYATAVAYNGYVYQIGGSTACPTAVVDYAAINSSTGAVGTGTATGSLPAATYYATAVAYNGYVYQIGGYAGSVTAVVDYAAITSSGALAAPASAACTAGGGSIAGDWCASNGTAGTGANLPAATYQATAVAYNGYVYQIGGSAAAVPHRRSGLRGYHQQRGAGRTGFGCLYRWRRFYCR